MALLWCVLEGGAINPVYPPVDTLATQSLHGSNGEEPCAASPSILSKIRLVCFYILTTYGKLYLITLLGGAWSFYESRLN